MVKSYKNTNKGTSSNFAKTRKLLTEYENMKFDIDKSAQKQVDIINAVLDEAGNSCMSAGWVAMRVMRKVQGVEGPMWLLMLDNYAMYPQYDLQEKMNKFLKDSKSWMKKTAQKNLKERKKKGMAHPDVIKHWETIVQGFYPQVEVYWVRDHGRRR